MINELPELYDQDRKFNIDLTKEVPGSWDLVLVFPKRLLSQQQMQDILKQEGIIL